MIRTLLLIALLSPAFLKAQTTCHTAIPVTAGTWVVDTIAGQTVPLPICAQNGGGASRSEWYSYTPSQNYAVTVTTDMPVNTGLDPRVHVYIGACDALTCVAGDDDSGSGFLAVTTFAVQAGTTYLIAFDNRWSAQGFAFQIIENDPIIASVGFTSMPVSTSGSAWAVVDMNGDHLDDVVSITASNIRIAYQREDGTFEVVDTQTPVAVYSASWSLAIGDIDANGRRDLLYGGGTGVSFMYANADGSAYTQVAGNQYVFSQRSNFVDINNDGHLDAFVCHDVQPNVYYINDGQGSLTFFQGGLGDTPNGGNYGSIWIDYDNDCDLDLFISKCRGGSQTANINQMHRNNGDGTFTDVSIESGLADNIQTWSSAWGDFDNDGWMDVLVGASSFENGGHKLMRNNGDGTFTDVTEGSGYDEFMQTGIEHVAHDFNNDGYVDVLGAGNIIMLNNGDFTFTPVPVGVGSGPVGDLNNDGFLDVLNGGTIRMNNGNDNNWIKVITVGTVSNVDGIGARVEVTSALGTQMRQVFSGDGFRYMSSISAHFGLAQDDEIEELRICWPSGIIDVIQNPPINSVLVVNEGLTTAIAPGAEPAPGLMLLPNPTDGLLRVTGYEGLDHQGVRVMDTSGRLVLTTQLQAGSLDVTTLSSGTYLLVMQKEGRAEVLRFERR